MGLVRQKAIKPSSRSFLPNIFNNFMKLWAISLSPVPVVIVPHKSVTTENHPSWTISLHYLPTTPCLPPSETSGTLYLFFCISNQYVIRPTWLLKRHERLLLHNSILECVRAKNGAVTGDRKCYVAELRIKFDPGNRLKTPGEIGAASGEKLRWRSVRVSQTWDWVGIRAISWDFAYWILNPSYLCSTCVCK